MCSLTFSAAVTSGGHLQVTEWVKRRGWRVGGLGHMTAKEFLNPNTSYLIRPCQHIERNLEINWELGVEAFFFFFLPPVECRFWSPDEKQILHLCSSISPTRHEVKWLLLPVIFFFLECLKLLQISPLRSKALESRAASNLVDFGWTLTISFDWACCMPSYALRAPAEKTWRKNISRLDGASAEEEEGGWVGH